MKNLNSELIRIKAIAYDSSSLLISDLEIDSESKAYKGCQFKLNGRNIVCRNGKITPRKTGQFVAFWKRNKSGATAPFSESDKIDFYIINVTKGKRIGQFLFPKSILLEKGIMATSQKDGKRGFRVYPIWDAVDNKQAKNTQQWQLNHFVEFGDPESIKTVKELFEKY